MTRCVSLSQYSMYFYWPSSINFPMQNLIQNYLCDFRLQFSAPSNFFVAEIVSVSSSLVPVISAFLF